MPQACGHRSVWTGRRRATCCRVTRRGRAGQAHDALSIIDAEGNRVAASITLNGWFGTGSCAGTGILLNNQMDDFAMKAGAPNMYGLVGAEANAIAPASVRSRACRPRSSRASAAWRSWARRRHVSFLPWCCSHHELDAGSGRRRASSPRSAFTTSTPMPCLQNRRRSAQRSRAVSWSADTRSGPGRPRSQHAGDHWITPPGGSMQRPIRGARWASVRVAAFPFDLRSESGPFPRQHGSRRNDAHVAAELAGVGVARAKSF